MNRSGVFLAAAGILALIAVVVGVPHSSGQKPTPVPADPTPVPFIAPQVPTVQDGSLTMTTRLSNPFISPGRQDVYMTVDLAAVDVPGATRSPVNLAMVIDRSGSMSGFKLNQAKNAARELVAQLRSSDRLTIVHYGSDVKSLAGMLATDENKQRMLAYIDGIWDDGGTNIGEALTTARDLLSVARSDYKVNRLILVSDGQPTEGIVDFQGLTGIVRELRGLGVSVSSIGVGDDFNEQLMASLAEVGAGAYGYLQDASQLSSIFQKDLNAAGTLVARGVSLTFVVPAGAQLDQALGYSQVTRAGSTVTIAMPDFSARQHERVVLHFVVDGVRDGQSVEVSQVELRYGDLLGGHDVKSETRVAAMTSSNVETVQRNQDKDAVVFAARARAAANSQQAAELLGNGDRDGAQRLLMANEVLFDQAAATAGVGAVAEDRKAQKDQVRGALEAKSDDDVRQWKKATNSSARKAYGLMGSTY
jgi:Ca-activated chloride channel family protein